MSNKSWRGVLFGGLAAAGDPTAPVFPSETNDAANSPELQRQNNQPGPYNPSANFPAEDSSAGNSQEESSGHVFYAVELLIFSLIGWGWLAIREYLGKPPVLDAAVVISVMVCALVNLVLALTILSRLEFAPCAHAFFTHCVALWVLYIYSLSESARLDTDTLCCVDGSGNRGNAHGAGPTHAAAFFGGLPMYQVPGLVSVAYLSVILLIAGAQARACTPLPKDWLVRGLGLSITSMIAMHLAAYLMGVPVCDKDQAWGVISIIVSIVAASLIVDVDWVMGMVYVFSFRHERSVHQRRDHRLIRSVIQTVGVGFLLFFCLIVALVVEKGLSMPLLTVFIVCLVVSALGLGYDAVTLYGSDILGVKAWEPEPESSGRTLGARMRQVGMSVFLGFYILNQNNDISTQYMVYTGVRTRDRGHPYLLPAPSPDNNAYDRTYGCMMDAEIGRGPTQCGSQESIKDFKACIRARPLAAQCDQYIAGSDMDVLRCLQRNYNVTIRQTNVFLECLSLSQPATFQSTPNADSTVFLGSYNYAVLLVNALTIVASFVVFTSGGWFFPGSVERNAPKENHLSGFWSPFSFYRIYVAWTWNAVAFIFAVVIAYSNWDVNAANRDDREKRFPVTLWTCVLSIGSLAVAVAYYTYYAFEWMFAGKFSLGYLDAGDSVETAVVIDDKKGTNSFFTPGRRQYPTQAYTSALTRRFMPLTRWRRGVGGGYLGVQLYDADAVTDADVSAGNIMPLMLQAFAWTWVLTDGLFFVGMLTSQSSITNESVTRVFFSITAGRLFQLAGAYLAYQAYIRNPESPDNAGNIEKTDVSMARCVFITSILIHAAGLLCIVIASVEFMSTLGFSYAASMPTASFPSYHSIQWCFIVFVVVLPETWRIINFLYATTPMNEQKFSNETLLLLAEGLFTWEWMARLIIAIITIIPLSVAVKDQQYIFANYMRSMA